MKRVVNHEDGRGGRSNKPPVGLQYLCQRRSDVCQVNHWRKVFITHLDREIELETCFSKGHVLLCLQTERLRDLIGSGGAGTLRRVLSEGMRCEMLSVSSSYLYTLISKPPRGRNNRLPTRMEEVSKHA